MHVMLTTMSFGTITPGKPPDQPCVRCRQYRLAPYGSLPPLYVCNLKPARRDVPFVSACKDFEREPGSDDE